MYQVGEWIFYGNIGACQVREVSRRMIPGMDGEHWYYTLMPWMIHAAFQHRPTAAKSLCAR